MRVFVTGASGFIGSAVVAELASAGHTVLGLARSEAAAENLRAAGAQVQHGDLDDLDGLGAAAAASDGVVHLAFKHDFENFAAAGQSDRYAIDALGAALAGSDRPLVVASGTAGVRPGAVATEDDAANPDLPRVSEKAALSWVSRGVRASAVRLPPSVHGKGDHGFVPRLIEIAREKGVSGYPGDGSSRWPAVHRFDAAPVFRLALESAPAGSRLHAVAEEGIPVRDIATTIGKRLQVPVSSVPPEQATDHFGWLGAFFAIDGAASSERTRQLLGWQPTGIGLLADLDQGHYF